MRRRSRLRLPLATLLAVLPWQGINASLDERLATIESLTSAFVQRSDEGGSQNGRFWIDQRGRYRIEIDSPSRQVIVSDSERNWFYDEDLEQVTVQPAITDVGQVPVMLFVTDRAELDEHFSITEFADEQQVHYLLEPRGTDSMFANVTLTFAGETPRVISINDNLGNRIEITFSSPAINTPIPEPTFSFEIPGGVDVIDET